MSVDTVDFRAIKYSNNWYFVPVKKYWKSYLISILVIVLGLIVFSSYSNDVTSTLLFLSITGVVVNIGLIMGAGKYNALKRFASDNGWKIADSFSINPPASVRFVGHNHMSINAVSGLFKNVEFTLTSHKYETGTGKNKAHFSLTFMKIQIPTKFPFILLDSKNNQGGAIQVPESVEEISLEGNFDRYFQMYTESKNRIDALSIITPDVMQTTMQFSRPYDIEIYGNDLYLFIAGDKLNKDHMRSLFAGADKILDELAHKAKSYRPLNTEGLQPLQASDMTSIHTFLGVKSIYSIIYNIKIYTVVIAVLAALFGLMYLIQ